MLSLLEHGGGMRHSPELALYYTPGACSLASHIALEESGLAFDCRRVGGDGGVGRSEYLEVNPRGSVPALLVDGGVLTENIAILRFIAGLAPELWPDDGWSQALCFSRMAWFASSVHIAFRQTRRPERFASDPLAFDAVRDAGHAAFRAALSETDGMLRGREWIVGDRFSVTDAYALVFYEWGLSNKYDMSALPSFTAFRDRCVARPAVDRVLKRERSLILST
jgi:glutathione S-transferase